MPAGAALHGQQLRCTHCGAIAQLAAPAAAVRCGYCGTDNPVPRELQDAIRNAQALQALQEVQLATMQQAQAAASSHARGSSVQYAMAGGLGLVVVVISVSAGNLQLAALLRVALMPLTLLAFAVASAVFARAHKQDKLRQLTLAQPSREARSATCSQCGGQLNVHAEDPIVRCSHCQATSLLPESVLSEHARHRQRLLLSEREQAVKVGGEAMRRARLLSVALFVVLLGGSVLSFVLQP